MKVYYVALTSIADEFLYIDADDGPLELLRQLIAAEVGCPPEHLEIREAPMRAPHLILFDCDLATNTLTLGGIRVTELPKLQEAF